MLVHRFDGCFFFAQVRFQHEVYPENTVQASRQVLLITELEIRDRLASSQINKFLYQYTSQARPKQSHAHMVSFFCYFFNDSVFYVFGIGL